MQDFYHQPYFPLGTKSWREAFVRRRRAKARQSEADVYMGFYTQEGTYTLLVCV